MTSWRPRIPYVEPNGPPGGLVFAGLERGTCSHRWQTSGSGRRGIPAAA
jgi:hypothetical protein